MDKVVIATYVYVQLRPNALIMGWTIAVAPAPRRQRTRLFAAMAVAGVE